MNKSTLLIIAFGFISSLCFGQVNIGAGLSIDTDFDLGVHARARINIQEKIDAVPQLTYYLTGEGTTVSFDGLVNYHITQIEEMPLYALGGLNLTRFSIGGFSSSEFGFSVGAGVIFKENFYIESRWFNLLCDNCGSDLLITGGYYF